MTQALSKAADILDGGVGGRHEAVTGEKESHMDDPRDESGNDDAVGRQTAEDGQVRSDALELAASTTLVEVTPGVAVVFGEVPDGLELISLDMVPSFDRAQLSTALGSFGNAGTIVGNVAEAACASCCTRSWASGSTSP